MSRTKSDEFIDQCLRWWLDGSIRQTVATQAGNFQHLFNYYNHGLENGTQEAEEAWKNLMAKRTPQDVVEWLETEIAILNVKETM